MKKVRLNLIILTLTLFSVVSTKATDISVIGQIPIIAEVLGIGFGSLHLIVDATNVVAGQLIISCNAPDFDVNFSVRNFASGNANFVNVKDPNLILPITSLMVSDISGVDAGIGIGANPINNLDINVESTKWEIDGQTTATVDYIVNVTASWTANPALLAGFYREVLVITVEPRL